MPLYLIRYPDGRSTAEFDPETNEFHSLARLAYAQPTSGTLEAAEEEQASPDGMFDVVGFEGELVTFYRTRAGLLELNIAGQRVAIGDETTSRYEPPDPGRLPLRFRGTGRRVLRIFEKGRLRLEYKYYGPSIWWRIIDGWNSVHPQLPAYDLLYEANRVFAAPGARDAIFRREG